MKRQVMVVGERPSSERAALLGPLAGPSLSRLRSLGLELKIRPRNLIPWAGPGWNRAEARGYAQSLWPAFAGREVVLLGRRVAEAFAPLSPWTDRLVGSDWFSLACPTIRSHDGRWLRSMIWVAPHPSGRNRWWNDPENMTRASVFWGRLVGRTEFPDPPALPEPITGYVEAML